MNHPLYKNLEFEFDESSMLIKQQLCDEDVDNVNNIDLEEPTVIKPMIARSQSSVTVRPKGTVKKVETTHSRQAVKNGPMITKPKHAIKTNVTATSDLTVKNQTTGKKNRNGKVGINKKSDYAYVKNAPRKLCNHCGSASHLTHLCSTDKSSMINVTIDNGNSHRTPMILRPPNVYGNLDCMPWRINIMSIYFNLPITANAKCSNMNPVIDTPVTPSPSRARVDKPKPKNKAKLVSQWVAKGVKQEKNDNQSENDDMTIVTNATGPNIAWVPNAT